MNFLSVENLSKSYGNKLLFEDITFGISKGQRVALVARNGAGKTSLIRILMGQELQDTGTIAFHKEIAVAYLEQNPVFNPESTVIDAIYQTSNPTLIAIKNYEECLAEVQENASNEATKKLQDATVVMEQLGAWDYETRIKEILSRLDIPFLHQKIATLSGGQKKRVALAKVLIQEPQLLILDEPTNHLDMQMTEWLEEFIVDGNFTILLVTHDRFFLDNICTDIIELEHGKLYQYKGNFSYYIEKKAEREEADAAEIDRAKNLYRRELEWVRRMPKARTTKAKFRVDNFSKIEEKAFSGHTETNLKLSVKMSRMGHKILELKNVTKKYGVNNLFKDFSYIFSKGEKIGIVGKNGTGKTTLLNIIMGMVKPDNGIIETGETIVFGYYKQGGLPLNEGKRVIDVVTEIAEQATLSGGQTLSAAQLLFRFQFTAEAQHDYVSKLSGGERQKLYLLTILMQNPNFLILDEPTNDLDIATLSVLEDFLIDFKGCVMVVTHDRYFLDKMVDHIFVLEGNNAVRDFPGNYTQYREKKDEEDRVQKSQLKKIEAASKPVVVEEKASDAKKKLSFKERNEFEKLEKEIADLEAEKTELNNRLNSGSTNHEEIMQWSERIGVVIELIDEKTMRWLELSEWA